MKTIALYSIKGGVGKTAASVNLAYTSSQVGNRTLLIDLDPQGASSFYFRIKENNKAPKHQFFSPKNRITKQIKGSNYPLLDILPASFYFRNFDLLLGNMSKSTMRLKKTISLLKDQYDLIILDCPPSINLLAENIFNAADVILVPVIPTTLSERTLSQLLDFFKQNDYSRKIIHPFFSMAQRSNKFHLNMIKTMEKTYPCFLNTLIGFSVAIEKMGIQREPALCYAGKNSLAQDYRYLFNEVINKLK
ncbi:MAG: ParA family protein [Epsilonproteobacteria bacterium]|nr:MAG: ParA family protein [Campylobacterota bacterium]